MLAAQVSKQESDKYRPPRRGGASQELPLGQRLAEELLAADALLLLSEDL